RPMDLAEAADDRPDELRRPLACRGELLREPQRGLAVAGHDRVGDVVALAAVGPRREPRHSVGVERGLRVDRERELLDLAGDALLARTGALHQLLGGLLVEGD